MEPLITVKEVADILRSSPDTIYRYIRVRWYEDDAMSEDEMPKDLRPYVGLEFPRPLYLNPRTKRGPRFFPTEVYEWMRKGGQR